MLPSYFYVLKDILIREPFFVASYYLHRYQRDTNNNYVFMADGKMIHGGLFDRLKGAISIYALSKVHGRRFCLYFTRPFQLEKYLTPNLYNWKLSDSAIYYSYPYSRPVIAYGESNNPSRLMKIKKGQIHFYFGGNILEKINECYGTSFEWSKLYEELFKPSLYLQSHIDNLKGNIGLDYYAIHLRFLNLLGDKFEPLGGVVLKDDKKNSLVTSCLIAIRDIISKQPKSWKPVVFSDSMNFLSVIKNRMPDVFVVQGNVSHIDNGVNAKDSDNLKVFCDMYLMIGAQRVFSIVGNGMHLSAFPEYSAKIGNKSFERIFIS